MIATATMCVELARSCQHTSQMLPSFEGILPHFSNAWYLQLAISIFIKNEFEGIVPHMSTERCIPPPCAWERNVKQHIQFLKLQF